MSMQLKLLSKLLLSSRLQFMKFQPYRQIAARIPSTCHSVVPKRFFANEKVGTRDDVIIEKDQESDKLSHLTFSNTESIFSTLKTSELIRSGVILSSMRMRFVFQHAGTLLQLTQTVLGKPLTRFILRKTLFKHFCGGETLEDLSKTGKKLAERYLGTIVDYAAESEDTNSSGLSVDWLESNKELTKEAISYAVHLRDAIDKNQFAFIATKITSMCPPKLCRHVTTSLNFMHSLYAYCAGFIQSEGDISSYDPSQYYQLVKTPIKADKAKDTLKAFWPNLSEDKLDQMIKEIQELKGKISSSETDNEDSISYIQWSSYFAPKILATLGVPSCASLKKNVEKAVKEYWVTQEDIQNWNEAVKRVKECVQYGKDSTVRLLVDAEQTFFQTAIDRMAIECMEEFCKIQDGTKAEDVPAIVYNTYQLYLTNGLEKLKYDIERAKVLGYKFAAKLVRGAYMVEEAKCANLFDYPQPIHDSIEKTHDAYESAVSYLMEHMPQFEVLCGTHNERSVLKFARKLGDLTSNDPKKLPMTFAQLYGMCDYMSLKLGKVGARSFKYVPYGPIDLVIPYLVRRAQENSSIASASGKEAVMTFREVVRRFTSFLGF